MMDVAVYESLRAGDSEVAAAQVVQNLKAKLQSVLQGGDWSAAWLLTGLPDPLARREFGGSKEEMSIISGYVEALHKLQKRVRESQSRGHADEEGDEQPSSSSKKCSRLELSSESLALFPSMLPYPEALLPAGTEVGTEEAITWWTKAFLNAFIAWGNFVTLGCPTSGSSAYEPRVGHRSMESIRVFTDELLGEMREFVCLDLVLGRLGCEGKRATVEQLLAQVSCTVGACYMSEPVGGSLPSTALPVTASRVAIPEVAGTVDPLQWLEPERADIVANLDRLRLPEPLWEDIVVACHRVPEEDEPALARKLLETGMAVLIPEQDLPRDSDGRLLAGGLFCVGKNAQEDRLIYDRRPENGTMPRLRWAELPSGACFTRMLLRPDQYLRGSGDDLRNYYYSLKLPENWIRFNSVGRRVCAEVLREQGRDPQVPHRLCFRVLGMGDRNGCCIAQATHEAVLKKHGVLQEAEKLVYGRRVPVGDRWEGVYLDDLLITQKVTMPYDIPLDGTFVPPAAQADDDDMVQVARAEQAYVKAKLQRAVHKAFRAETSFRAWGAEVDGIKGCVGAPKEMRKQLWVLIEMIVAGGYVCQDVLRKIVGYLAFCFQYRRELYALLHHMYKYIDRRQLSGTIVATDATPTGGGAVFANAVRLDRESDLRLDAEVPAEPSKFASVVSWLRQFGVAERGQTAGMEVFTRILSNASWLELLERREADDRKDGASRWLMRWGSGKKAPRLRDAALTAEYRPVSKRSSSRALDAALEGAVDWAYQNHEKLYRVTLGVLGVQRVLESKLEALLRPGEAHNLHVEDILLPDSGVTSQGDEGLVITIRRPKTRRVWRAQFVLVKDEALIRWMRWWVKDARPHRRLFRVGRRTWAQQVAEGFASLDLGDRGYTLSSFRGGGATNMFRRHMNLAQLQYHGRWARQETLKAYLQEAFSVQVAASASTVGTSVMSDRISRALRELADALDDEAWEVTRSPGGGRAQAEELLREAGRRLQSSPVTGPSAQGRGVVTREPVVAGPTTSSSSPSRTCVTSASPGTEAVGARDTTASSVAYHRDWRIYVILANPKKPWMVGVISGPSPETWRLIERNLPGGRLSDSSGGEKDAVKVAAQCALDAAGVAAARLGTAEAVGEFFDYSGEAVFFCLAVNTGGGATSFGAKWTWANSRFLVVKLWVVALVLALLVKLCVRAVVALLTHVCKELFFQVMSAASDIEDGLVAYLSQQLGMHPAPPPPFLTNGPVPPQQATAPVAPQTLPARPFDLITVVLLVWNLRRGLPAGG
ncbi:unnamed protein product, partial [Symbiodinium microadriaticum]